MMNRTRTAATAMAVSLLIASGMPAAHAAPQSSNGDPVARCESLEGLTVAADKLGTSEMLRGAATITKAEHFTARDAVLTADNRPTDNAGNSTAVQTPAKPDFCQVTGNIAAVTDGAQPIGFQINLPEAWSGFSLQFGGGGFNGVLPDATGHWRPQQVPGSAETPLMQGYMTLSTDSGHLVTASPRAKSTDLVEAAGANFDFALNEEMWRNFSTDAYKKVHDLGREVALQHYDRRPDKTFFMGSSEGGREALLMAQRHPTEFDGIFSRVPVIGWTGLFHNFIATVQAQDRDDRAGGFTSEDITLVARATAAACDSRDGIEDGVVSDYLGCQDDALEAIQELRCEPGSDSDCLSDAQIRALETVYNPLRVGVPLPSGPDVYPGFLVGGEEWSLGSKLGTDPEARFGDRTYPNFGSYGIGAGKYVFAQDPNLDVVHDYEAAQYAERIREVSRDMDTFDTDLSAFHRSGGKLIIQECSNDFAQSAKMGMNYYGAVVERMGKRTTNDFVRLYVATGNDHGCTGTIDPAALVDGQTPYGSDVSEGTRNGVPRNVDWLPILEGWVNGENAPGRQVIATTNDPAPPFGVQASKPVCRYPLYPRYTGGDSASADSFTCMRTRADGHHETSGGSGRS